MSPHQEGLFLLLLLAAATTSTEVLGLRISSVEVPPAVMNSSQVTLVCNYDLQGDQLYSVKWYKNYVEFYRFQPNESPGANNAGGSTQSQASSADNQPHSKHEFELDGINLNLSKSNATHVHLQQVSLASEGTYKCELSAESPSFATISIERQMKVYILPKQKLSILDNSMSSAPSSTTTTTTNQLNQRSIDRDIQQTMKPTLIYNINDFVNLTCVSSASRPQARLTWLLNDMPVAATSKWLQYSTRSKLQGAEQLMETKLTLAFRLQPSHLLKGLGGGGGGGGGGGVNQAIEVSARYQPLKLRCLSKLSVQYSSESSIIVSGGKTTIRRRQEISHTSSSLLPAPSSLSSQHEQTISTDGSRGGMIAQVGTTTDYPIYRWPRPLIVSATNGRQGSGRKNSSAPSSHEIFSDPWIISHSSSRATAGSAELLDAATSIDSDGPLRTGSRPNARHLVVWTNRQLRDQAEHIDSVMRLSHPNELDTPLIEGKIQLENPDEIGYGNTGDQGASSDTTDSSSLAENWTDKFNGARPLPDATTTTAKPFVSLSNTNQDYELDDLVQFTCKPRVSFAEDNSIKSVISKWFINDKEISAHLVNAFDGNKFYYSRDSYDIPLNSASNRPRPTTQYQNPSSDESEGNDTQFTNTEQSEGSVTTTPVPPATHSRQQNHPNESSLLVEFSSSLFQLKELNLKCRTVVEQPLIQYDSQVVISVPTNQFIQVENNRLKTGGSFYRTPNSRLNGRVYNNNGNQRAKNSNVRSSTSVSALEFNWRLYLSLLIIANYLLAKHLLCLAR